MSEYLQLPQYSDDQPLVEHPFYQWLTANCSKLELSAGYRPSDWLRSLGFERGVDRISEHGMKTLSIVEEHWWRCSPYFEPHWDKDLFTLPTRDTVKFYIQGSTHNEFMGITHKLQTMVVEAGWIYNVHPSTTYFEVIEGRLYAKYQQIIGSRYICDIIDYKEQQS